MFEFRVGLAAAILVLCSATSAYTQDGSSTPEADSVAAPAAADEIVLDEILIEGVVEKPNVTILRNRLQSDFEEVGFVERSFEREVRALPGKEMLFDREFETVTRITNLKKILQEILSGE
ncbi:MAG: hypothetical protein ACE5IY_12525 [bacterium]